MGQIALHKNQVKLGERIVLGRDDVFLPVMYFNELQSVYEGKHGGLRTR